MTETISIFTRIKYWSLNVLRVCPLQFMFQILEVLNLISLAILTCFCRSHWPHSLWRGSAAARLLRLWVRILPGAWMSVCCECCVLSGRGLCSGLITGPEESYRLCCAVGCGLETSWMRRPWPIGGCYAKNKQTILNVCGLVDMQLLLQYSQSAVDIRRLNSVFCFLKTLLPLTWVQSHLQLLLSFLSVFLLTWIFS
jgi:hypothetical protein